MPKRRRAKRKPKSGNANKKPRENSSLDRMLREREPWIDLLTDVFPSVLASLVLDYAWIEPSWTVSLDHDFRYSEYEAIGWGPEQYELFFLSKDQVLCRNQHLIPVCQWVFSGIRTHQPRVDREEDQGERTSVERLFQSNFKVDQYAMTRDRTMAFVTHTYRKYLLQMDRDPLVQLSIRSNLDMLFEAQFLAMDWDAESSTGALTLFDDGVIWYGKKTLQDVFVYWRHGYTYPTNICGLGISLEHNKIVWMRHVGPDQTEMGFVSMAWD